MLDGAALRGYEGTREDRSGAPQPWAIGGFCGMGIRRQGLGGLAVRLAGLVLGAALVALFFAWRRIYRPAQACRPGEVCAIPQVRATYKLIFWVVAVLVLVALGFPYVMPFFY